VWGKIRDVGSVHRRLAPSFVVDCRLEAGGAERVVTFANGLVARELIVDTDDAARRLVWAVVGGRPTHHNASLQVFAEESGGSRIVWIADLLPNDLAGPIDDMMEQAMRYFRTVGRKEACDIVQGQRLDVDGIGCSFCDITPPFIRWREEMSAAGGTTWRLMAKSPGRCR
jgi:hypothetical protein